MTKLRNIPINLKKWFIDDNGWRHYAGFLAFGYIILFIGNTDLARSTNDFPVELDYATYCGIVQTKYEAGQLTFDNFISMAERMRSGFLTALERQDIEKARQIIELAESVPEQVTVQELTDMTNELLVLTTRPAE